MNIKLKVSLFLLRIAIGGLFLYAGVDKLLNGFSAEKYLLNATSGPLASIFESMAGSPIVDTLVISGEIGIGLSLLFGVFTRFGSLCGILMMTLFYMSNTAFENGPITQHVIYSLVFVVIIFSAAGRFLGLDSVLERQSLIKQNYKYFKYILG